MVADASRRIPLLLMAALLVGVVVAALGVGSLAVVSAERAAQNAVAEDLPCGLTGERVIDPVLVAETGEITVNVRYGYSCPTDTKRVNIFMLIENSRELDRSGWGAREHMSNLREALGLFVDKIDYDTGSKGGMMLYSNRHSTKVELSGGASGKAQLKSAVRSFQVGNGTTANAFGEAIQEASAVMLAEEGSENATNAILFVQSGARVTSPSVDIDEACQAAKDAGITIAGIALEGVEEPLASCTSEGWFRTAARDNGEDLLRIIPSLGSGLVSGHQAAFVEYCDGLAQDFEFVEGSAIPRPPDSSALDTYCWQDMPPAPTEGYTLTYKIKPKRDTANAVVATSLDVVIRLTFEDSTWAEEFLDPPDVCVYKPGEADFCDRFARTLTPPVPTATDVPTTAPTDVPTEPSPTETPTPGTPTTPEPTDPATEEPGGETIYLPLVLKSYTFE